MKRQSYKGINIEFIVVQENDIFHDFTSPNMINMTIKRQPLSNDYGAAAKDVGLSIAKGEYCCFFDDDNIYYDHALCAVYNTVEGHDIGICRAHYKDMIIPIDNKIKASYIDTMCFSARTELAKNVKWAGGGRFSDFRYIENLRKLTCNVNFSKTIIGEHL